jgi:long-chain acyl-CoA synthetase
MSELTVPELIRAHAEATPTRRALVTWDGGGPRQAWTYAELDVATDRIAAGLAARGLAPGDRLALALDNQQGSIFYRLLYGAYKAGIVPVPINTRLAPREIAHITGDSGSSELIATQATIDAISGQGLGDCRISSCTLIEELEQSSEPVPAGPGLEDPADLLYTSGTTGLPKGSAFRHRSLAITAANIGSTMRLVGDDVFQTPAPVYTSTGTHTCPLPVLAVGATYVLEPGFDVERSAERLASEATTVFFGVPAMLMLLLDRLPVDRALPHLRSLMYGGSPISEQVISRLHERFPDTGLWNLYGLTEGGPTGCILPPEYAIEKLGSVGRAVDGTELKVVDDDGKEVPADEPGEIIMRAQTLMDGYWNAPEPTAATLVNGWLHTGDIGKKDAEGFVYLLDRKKDLIIRGGFNVYPAEIEAVLHEHPGVREAAVVAIPHRVLGEEACAVVAPREGVELDQSELAEFCAERLADFKRPRLWRIVPELPRSTMGKVLKRELRDQLAKELAE